MTDDRKQARQLAAQALRQGKPLDWFESLYRQAAEDAAAIPWADMSANPNLVEWMDRSGIDGAARSALVVGCGLGDDAELLARRGFDVTAFDISATCIEWCRRRFSESPVKYSVADLFAPPSSWRRAFDLVLEAYTLQVLPHALRKTATRELATFVAEQGTLLLITRGRDEDEDPGKMPWPLTRGEILDFDKAGLTQVRFEDYLDAEDPPVRRFRVEYRKA